MRGAALALALAAAPASAQSVDISAAVDKNVVALDGQVTLTVTVLGPQTALPEPEMPTTANFTVYSSARSQNYSIVNGQVSASNVYTYILTPRFVGKSVIGPIGVTVQGRRFETQPIEIQVVRPSQAAGAGAAPPQGLPPPAPGAPGGGFGPDAFVTATVDKAKAYVNEQVTLTVRFHTAVALMGNPQYQPPKLEGFITEDLPPERHGQFQSRGRLYHFSEIKTALFPVQPGRLAIGSALIRCQIQAEFAIDPFAPDFFQKFFSQGLLSGQTRELRTEPITLTVAPLPEPGKPPSFTGAVGEYRITAGVDKRQPKAGEAVNLVVSIEGTGNLKALGEPKPPEMPGFRVYDTLSSMSLDKTNDVVRGSKEFKTVIVPRASGTQRIPSIPFSYFDPARGEYVQAGTAPIDLEVAPAPAGQAPVGFVGTGPAPAEVTTVVEDIRFVKAPDREGRLPGALASLAQMTWPHLVPMSAFLLSLATGLYRERLLADPAGARSRAALPGALKKVRRAQALLHEDPAQAAAQLSEALAGYLAGKLGAGAAGLTLRETTELLRSRFPGLGERRLAELRALREDLDMLRFAGKTAGPEQTARIASFLQGFLKAVERELKP